jgi:hypothetical protein
LSLFCRHNRLEQNCTICQREKSPPPKARTAAPRRAGGSATRASSPRSSGRLVTRKIARATEDGFRNEVIPGVKATADAERLADALAVAAARLDFPGPYPALAELKDEAAVELAFLLARALDEPDRQAAVLEGDRTGIEAWDPGRARDDPTWSPQRRFARLFDRLRIPGFTRAQRFDFLATLAAAGQLDAEADSLFFDVKANDPTTLAAKRALNSGDAMLLERRAKALAEAAGVPLAALDRGLVLWDSTAPLDAPEDNPVRAALGV